MSDILRIVLAFLATFFAGLLIAPPVISLMRKLKASQVVLGYVEQHKLKSGTPTIGGLIFVPPVIIMSLVFGFSKFTLVAAAIVFSYAMVGFLDDFIKIKFKQNLGLRAYQKMLGQFGIAAIVAVFCFKNQYIGSQIYIPYFKTFVNLGWWYIPFVMVAFIGLTNAVNLTDGLDGLASSVGLVYFITFCILLLLGYQNLADLGKTAESAEMLSLAVFSACFAGGLAAFIWFNSNPASIMMGDTGSLAIGGGVAVVAVFLKNPLLPLLVGITYLGSCISVVMQVIYFKLTKKRIFLMSPFHHHLEKKGIAEQKIVWRYVLVSVAAAALAFLA